MLYANNINYLTLIYNKHSRNFNIRNMIPSFSINQMDSVKVLLLPLKFFYMNCTRVLLLIVLGLFLTGCGGSKILSQKKIKAETEFSDGNYTQSLSDYEEVIKIYSDNNNSSECPVYTKSGISAFKVGNYDKAVKYLKNDKNPTFRNEETLFYLGMTYNKLDNLSMEMMTLQDYLDLYPDGKNRDSVNELLFYVYSKSDNYDKAIGLWPNINKNYDALSTYLHVNDQVGNTDACFLIADELMELNPQSTAALLWYGKYYYRQAEDRYQREMNAYNKNKTNKQYRKLLSSLEVVTNDFKKSLEYFKRLYQISPSPEYANYLSHIYNRLSDKKKSQYYRKLADG